MYERFTDRARRVFQLANTEAQRLNHEYLGTEHILLGLIKEGSGVACNVLKNAGIELRQVHEEILKLVQMGPNDTVAVGKLPQTPRAKRVIEHAMAIALGLRHNHVGTEHILLGLLKETENAAAQVLLNLGATFDSLRTETMRLLGEPTGKAVYFRLEVLFRCPDQAIISMSVDDYPSSVLAMSGGAFDRLAEVLTAASRDKSFNIKVEISHERKGKEGRTA